MGRKVAIGIVVVVLFLAVARFALQRAADGGAPGGHTTHAAALTEAPEADLITVADGKKVKLSSFKGKALLVNFWASWCEACMEEMPTIVKLHNTLKNEAFEVVSINVDEDPAKVVPGIVKKFGMEFPVYVDSEEKLAAAFHVVAIPYNIVIGKDHKISWTESGERDWASDEILSKFRGLMK
jgi:thiol-disulfide isomerase/thioredoxin